MNKKLNAFDRLMLAVTFAEAGVSLPEAGHQAKQSSPKGGERPQPAKSPERGRPLGSAVRA